VEQFDILAVTTFGLEAVAVRELSALGYEGKGVSTGRVLFRGDARAVARANLWMRTADRILIRVASFPAADFDALFEGVKAIAWEDWIPPDGEFPVNGRSVRSKLSSVPACQRATKRAIVDRLMVAHRTKTLPETGAKVEVEVSLLHDVATLTIDTSGVGLHKRGYRPMVGEAALKETLAAGLVLLSVWRPERPLVDPFCGTGTIAIEAAMIGKGMAPGLKRSFDAEKWERIGERVWWEAREEAEASPTGELAYTIHASDTDERALGLARQAAKAAGVEREVHFKKQPFDALTTKAEYGCIVTNPPYGERMGDAEEIERLYRLFPVVLRKLPTWSFHILTGRLDLEEIVGQKATRRRKFYNAQIECWYFSFLGPKRVHHGGTEGAEKEVVGQEVQESDGGSELGGAADGLPPSPLPGGAARRGPPPALLPEGGGVKTREATRRVVAAPAFGGLREKDEREAREFAARLEKNVRHLRKYPARGVTCYRVYERDVPAVPLIIDVYEGRVHVAEYEREHSRTIAQQADWWDRMRGIIAEVVAVPVERVYTKEKRRQRGLTQHEKQAETGESFVVHEGGLKFEVNLRDYIDTGLFLDHRLTRAKVREEAKGKRFLNLFCYTGSFTVYAAAGGAGATTSVDLSNTYLEWARRNLELNGMRGKWHRLVRSDVMEFLRRHPRGGQYDFAVVDPPTYSRSKATPEDWDVLENQAEMFRLLFPLMSPRGVVYFSTNFRRFKLDEGVLEELGVQWREIRTVPPEYRNQRIHRCWRMAAAGRE